MTSPQDKKDPDRLPGIKLEDSSDEDSATGAAAPPGSAVRGIDQSGTKGFSPQLSGHGKANHANTSSFDAGPPAAYPLPGNSSPKETQGQEEGGRKRQPNTSAAGRIIKKSPA